MFNKKVPGKYNLGKKLKKLNKYLGRNSGEKLQEKNSWKNALGTKVSFLEKKLNKILEKNSR